MKLKTFRKNNFGDLPLNKYLFEKINGKPGKFIGLSVQCRDPHLIISGSILSYANSSSIIWGAGFMNASDLVFERPRRIYAVRGKLTWEILEKQGVWVPYIFGDPALLLPRYYQSKVTKKHDLGIIPHYVDEGSSLLKKFKDWEPHVKMISVCSGIESFIDQINECERIVSSSLHGLIVADAYGVPNGWIRISDNVVGNGFKFRDYFTNRTTSEPDPLHVTKNTSDLDLMSKCKKYKLNVDLDKLEASCPIGRV